MNKKNVILLTDHTDPVSLIRIYGPNKVAYELRQYGIDVTVINFLHMWSYNELTDIMEQLINKDTLFVGFNTFFYKDISGIDVYGDDRMTFKPADPGLLLPHGKTASNEFLKWLKNRNQVLVLGGPTAVDIKENGIFDYVLQGFTERSILNFVDHLSKGVPLTNSYKSIFGPTHIMDTNVSECYDFSKSSFKWDNRDCVLPGEVLNIEVARGCIFKCSFCHFPMIGKKKFDYIKDFDILKSELIDNYDRFGTTRYFFSDETFNDSIHKVELIEKISKELPFQLEYFAYLRLDLIERNPESIQMLYDSGLRYTHFGIETLNPVTGKTIGKTFTYEKAKKTLERFREVAGEEINLHGTFMVGLPHETEEDIMETHRLLKNKDIPLDSFYFLPLFIPLEPFPQSEFSRNYKNYGYTSMSLDDPIWGEHVKQLGDFSKFPGVIWQNNTNNMNFFQAEMLANKLNDSTLEFRKLGHVAGLGISGLGISPEYWKTKTYAEVDWPWVSKVKQQRAIEYKNMLRQIVQSRI